MKFKAFIVFIALLSCLLFTYESFAKESGRNADKKDDGGKLSIGGLYYLSYKMGKQSGGEYSEFFVYRAYLTVQKSILPYLSSRITLDANQDEEGDGRGDMEVRIKYVYANFILNDFLFITSPNIEFGMVHGPWLDFEGHINYYRMREKMFIARNGIINSADFGVTLSGLLGGELDEQYRREVNDKYPCRWGSFACGIYNGGGYHAVEENTQKAVEGRLSIRPLPVLLPGLQLSGFTVFGRGNATEENGDLPNWELYLTMLSYEHKYITFTAQYAAGEGNQKGDFVKDNNLMSSVSYDGFSLFSEIKIGEHWKYIAGYDEFRPRTSQDDFARYFIGIGYDFGGRNILMFDYDVKDYDSSGKTDDHWYQLSMQVKF
ncbi:MAG: hypothetical protein H8E87_03880 [FCB group bacterium]|nr:hypothetical protein [FCB group bacterium]